MLLILLSAVGVFAGTNIDDLIVLTTLFASGLDRRTIALGQYIGVTVLVAISVVAALLLVAVPDRWVGLFGIIPLVLGVRLLFHREHGAPKVVTTAGGVIAVTVANGADNVSAYAPLFREAGAGTIGYIAVFVVLVAVWLAAAHWLARRALVAATLDRYGHVLVPLVYITIGGLLIAGSIAN